MKACSTCKESMKNCIDTHSFAFAHLYSDEKSWICIFTIVMKSIIRSPVANNF